MSPRSTFSNVYEYSNLVLSVILTRAPIIHYIYIYIGTCHEYECFIVLCCMKRYTSNYRHFNTMQVLIPSQVGGLRSRLIPLQ